jgi:hypothetical protein
MKQNKSLFTNRKQKQDSLSGIHNEVDGLKRMIHDMHTMITQLDYDMRRDVRLIQLKVIGLETKLHVDGLHEMYKRLKPKNRKDDTK